MLAGSLEFVDGYRRLAANRTGCCTTWREDQLRKSMIYLDFETRSEADLTKVGAVAYAQHPSTEVIVACYARDDEPCKWHVRAYHGWQLPEIDPRISSKRTTCRSSGLSGTTCAFPSTTGQL